MCSRHVVKKASRWSASQEAKSCQHPLGPEFAEMVLDDSALRSLALGELMRSGRRRGDTKGFLFRVQDSSRLLLCRDVPGFPAAFKAASLRAKGHFGPLLIVIPNNDLEDWLARWSEDVGRVRRTITLTRRADGATIMLVVTLHSYGAGVQTALAIQRLLSRAHQQPARPHARNSPDANALHTEDFELGLRRRPSMGRGSDKSA